MGSYAGNYFFDGGSGLDTFATLPPLWAFINSAVAPWASWNFELYGVN